MVKAKKMDKAAYENIVKELSSHAEMIRGKQQSPCGRKGSEMKNPKTDDVSHFFRCVVMRIDVALEEIKRGRGFVLDFKPNGLNVMAP